VGPGIERRGGAEFVPPLADGANVLEVLVQHVGDHTQDLRQVAVCDFILKVADYDRPEVIIHDIDCFAPISRNKAGWSWVSIMRPAKEVSISSSSDCFGHFGSGKGS